MLELKPTCERCGTALAPDQPGACICSFECTFCEACTGDLEATCPNCGGVLLARPPRPTALLS